jgi:hypothetical protein
MDNPKTMATLGTLISFEFWILKSYYILVHPSEFVLVIILVFCVVFLVLLVCFVLCLVCPMLPLSLDCPFLIVPSVFSNVYLLPIMCPVSCVPNVSSIGTQDIVRNKLTKQEIQHRKLKWWPTRTHWGEIICNTTLKFKIQKK